MIDAIFLPSKRLNVKSENVLMARFYTGEIPNKNRESDSTSLMTLPSRRVHVSVVEHH